MYIPGYETNNGQTKHREVNNKQCGTNANSTNKQRDTQIHNWSDTRYIMRYLQAMRVCKPTGMHQRETW